MGYTRQGLMKMLLSHHPACSYYRDHVIRLNLHLFQLDYCLGCSGFYPSVLLSFMISLIGLLGKNWVFLVSVSIVFFSPSIIRLFIYVPTRLKTLRFLTKIFLGLAVGIGLYTVIIAENIFIMSFQLLFGLVLYIILTYQRLNDSYPECGPCNYYPSPVCPGMSTFYDHKVDVSLLVEKI